MAQKSNNDKKLLVRASLLAILRKVGGCRKASLARSFFIKALRQRIINLLTNMSEVETQKVKKITLGLVVSWIFGIVFLLAGAMTLASHVGGGILIIIAALIALPPVSKLMAEKLKFTLSGGLKFFVIIILIGFGIGLSTASQTAENSSIAPSAANNQPAEQAIAVTASKLMADYEANEVAADAQYKNKLVTVSGSIFAIGKDVLNIPYVALNGNSPSIIFNVQCMFDKGDQAQLSTLAKDQKITLQGRVSGKLGNVLVKDCSIVR